MNMDELREIVAEQLSVTIEEVKDDKSFTNDLGADSLDLFELAMALEEKFDIEIPSEDLQQIQTVAEAAKYIEAKLQ